MPAMQPGIEIKFLKDYGFAPKKNGNYMFQ